LAPEKPSFLSENVKERMKLKIVSIAFSLEVKKLFISEIPNHQYSFSTSFG
jgi:plasmid maintenance system antidote protein VapI